MLGEFGLHPLLKGWKFKYHTIPLGPIAKLPRQPVFISIKERGWGMWIVFITTDAYGTVRLSVQDPELELNVVEANPEGYFTGGGVAPDPASGYCPLYFRPNPNSTLGLYQVNWFLGGFQASPLPYIPTVKVEAFLGELSTQTAALLEAKAFVVALTDMKKFIQSLRRILQERAPLGIDKELEVVGPAEFPGY